jgi:transcriptional regulator with XRE-family HTH domain
MREKKYPEMGLQLKVIREHLKMTLDEISADTGISRSYISDFERGFKLPTGKFLKYLHNRHRVNLNFIYCSEGRMLRPAGEDEALDFGKFQEDVDELLHLMARIPHAIYAILGFFTEYKLENKHIIEKYMTDSKKV